MLIYSELIELRDKLINGELDLELAKAQCWNNIKEGQRSWHTKDWKVRRAEIIKDKCEICNGNEILTLQHLSHPRKYSEYLREITKEYTKEYIGSGQKVDKSELSDYVLKKYD